MKPVMRHATDASEGQRKREESEEATSLYNFLLKIGAYILRYTICRPLMGGNKRHIFHRHCRCGKLP